MGPVLQLVKTSEKRTYQMAVPTASHFGRVALSDLPWEIHAPEEVLEARVGAQTVHSEVSFQEVRKVGRSFLVRFFQEFEGVVLFTQARVDRCNHIGRNVARF